MPLSAVPREDSFLSLPLIVAPAKGISWGIGAVPDEYRFSTPNALCPDSLSLPSGFVSAAMETGSVPYVYGFPLSGVNRKPLYSASLTSSESPLRFLLFFFRHRYSLIRSGVIIVNVFDHNLSTE